MSIEATIFSGPGVPTDGRWIPLQRCFLLKGKFLKSFLLVPSMNLERISCQSTLAESAISISCSMSPCRLPWKTDFENLSISLSFRFGSRILLSSMVKDPQLFLVGTETFCREVILRCSSQFSAIFWKNVVSLCRHALVLI